MSLSQKGSVNNPILCIINKLTYSNQVTTKNYFFSALEVFKTVTIAPIIKAINKTFVNTSG